MKTLILLITIFLSSISVFAQRYKALTLSNEQKVRSVEIVDAWLTEVFKAKSIKKLMKMSDVPFALDGKKVLTSKSELKEIYLEVFENKGKRTVPQFEIEVLEYKSEILDSCIPLNFVKVVAKTRQGDKMENVVVCVLIKENDYKIVGLID